MGTRIYVGGLPYSTTDADLENLFSASGTVSSASVVTDKYTGQSKGFGFVEMGSDADAQAAISALNGTSDGWPHIDGQRSAPARRAFGWRRWLWRWRWR